MPVHQEQGAGHDGGEALDAAVGLLVGGEIVGVEGAGEGGGLAEAEGEAFAGDGVDGSGGVADEGDVAGGDAMESASERDGAAGRVAWMRGGEAMAECGEVNERVIGSGEFCGRR